MPYLKGPHDAHLVGTVWMALNIKQRRARWRDLEKFRLPAEATKNAVGHGREMTPAACPTTAAPQESQQLASKKVARKDTNAYKFTLIKEFESNII